MRRLAVTVFLLAVLSPPLCAAEPTGEAKEAWDAAYKLMKEKKYREACALYEKGTRLAPDSQEIWIEYTVCLRCTNRLARSVMAGWRALELDEESNGMWGNLGNSFSQAHEWDAAMAAYKSAEELSNDKRWNCQNFLNLGYAQWICRDLKAAEATFDYAMKKYPDSGMVLLDLACVHATAGDLKKAAEEFDKAAGMLESEGNQRALVYLESIRAEIEDKGRLDPPRDFGPSYQKLPAPFLKQPEKGKALSLAMEKNVRKCFFVPKAGIISIEVPEEWVESIDVPEDKESAGKEPKEGDFPFVMQGVLKAGGVEAATTLLMRTKEDKFIKSMIKLLGTISFEK